jgi:hypothetical protein
VRLILVFFFRRFVLFRRLILLCRFFLSRTFRLRSLVDLARLLVGLLSLPSLLLLALLGFALSLIDLGLLPLVISRLLLALLDLRRALIHLRWRLLSLLNLRLALLTIGLRLALINLRRPLRVRIVLARTLSFLNPLLFAPLAVLVLFQAHILKLLLLLFGLRICVAGIVRT